MNISISYTDDQNATLAIEVAKADYAERVDKALKTYQKRANIPGFRPGKAPMGMIQKMYGASLLVDEVNNFVNDTINNYLKENNIETLGQPILNNETAEIDWQKDENFTFKFDIGIAPRFDLNISKNDLFIKHIPQISDELINQEVERLQKRYGNQTLADTVADNDIILVNATELNDEGQVLEGGVNAEFTVLTSATNNADVKKQFEGQKVGAVVDSDLFELLNRDESEIATVLKIGKQTVADLHHNFRFEIKEIRRNEPAAINQELFDKVHGEGNVTSEEEFRQKVKAELQTYYASEADHALEHEMYDTLQRKHPITLPDDFLKRWLMDRHPDKFTPANVDQKYVPEGNYLRSTLFQEKVIADRQIKIEDEDLLNAAVNYTKRMFFGYNLNVPVSEYLLNYAKEQLQDNNFRSRMLNMAIETKVIFALKDMVTIEEREVAMEEFLRLMREHSEKHHGQQHSHDEHDHDHDHDHEHGETAASH